MPDVSPPLQVARVAPAIGAVVTGVDLARVDAGGFTAIHDALIAHHVIFLRGQSLTHTQLTAFARRFGEPQLATESSFGKLEGFPEIDVLDYDAARPPYVTKEMWHTDFSGRERPTMGSVLYAVDVPASGGDTIWVSLAAAYDALSSPMKNYLAGLRAEHRTIKAFGDDTRSNLWKDEAGRKRFAQIQSLPPAEHPVVCTHPVSGCKLLYVNEGYTVRLIGVDRKESDAVLGYLFDHLRTPEFQVRHRWQKGDVAVWDNRITLHYAIADYRERRVMYRITIKGEHPA
jgi:taurine dioxygenase